MTGAKPGKRIKVGVLFGGRSGEHEVSLLSAASIIAAMDKQKYEVVPIGITKQGRWVTNEQARKLLRPNGGQPLPAQGGETLAEQSLGRREPRPEDNRLAQLNDRGAANLNLLAAPGHAMEVAIVFPVLHGTFGEDGTIQGLLEMADMPYVGAGVLGSAAGMDKDVMKRLFRAAGLPMVKHVSILRPNWERNRLAELRRIEKSLKYPVFVKPANLGSSVGISKARNRRELEEAVALAASFDRKIVVESAVGGVKSKAREIECSVLGNDNPEASVAGEIIPAAEFYDYAAKYLDGKSQLLIPARITRAEQKQVQKLAIQAFQAVDCAGLARIDFLMDPRTRKIYVNEINTMPGFTAISMYPKLWQASGLEYPELIDRLIQLGLESHAEKKKNRYSV